MTAQFWWGLAMLPLGTIGLAAIIFVPWFVIAWIGDRRAHYPFAIEAKRGRSKNGFHTLGALVAIADRAVGFRLPIGWRVFVVRDRPGARPSDPDCQNVMWAIEDAIKTAEKEAE